MSAEEEKRLRIDACRTAGLRSGLKIDAAKAERSEPVPSEEAQRDTAKPAGTLDSTLIPQGVWKLAEAKPYEKPPGPAPSYPTRWTSTEGRIVTHVGVRDVSPPGRQVFEFTWTRPPDTLVPGEDIAMTMEGRVVANQVGGRFLDGAISADFDEADSLPGYVTRSRFSFGNGERDVIRLSQDNAENVTVRLEGKATVPRHGELGSAQSGLIQLRVMVTHRATIAYRYIYRWVPAP